MRAAQQLRENCARSTLQTLDLEAAFGSLFTGPLLYYLASANLPPLRAFVGHQIPIQATDPDRTPSCP